ncbi:MAG: ribonuclease domain-containing protein [Oscillospiraceae bacterium]
MRKILLAICLCVSFVFISGCNNKVISAASESLTDYTQAEPDSGETTVNSTKSEPQTESSYTQTTEASEVSVSQTQTADYLTDTSDNYESENTAAIDEHGTYTTKDDVALYIHTYNKLPDNFITKKEAEALGWPGGELEKYAPGKCIGGSYFGNYEKLLPTKKGREYHECDIDTLGAKSRGAKRIVYSNDGLIYYTEDHYESFELLYGEE